LELVSVRIERPSTPGRARLVGEVVYDGVRDEPDQYWFDVPESSADLLTETGNPFLACLLPLAMTRREPIRLCAPVDPLLLETAPRLMEIWTGWYPHLRPVPIHAEKIPDDAPSAAPEAASMFSGGVDSFFTVLREHAPDRAGLPGIDRLLAVWGFDIPLERPQEFSRLRERLLDAASCLGKPLVDVATNLKSRRFRQADWGKLSHGSALASVALALEKGFRTVYIPPSLGRLQPWGSHPDTDPLHSTSRLRIIHDAPEASRWCRAEFVSRSPVAMRNLHVCPRDKDSRNCGECRKCYVLKLTLEILGGSGERPAFETPGIDLGRVRRLYAKKPTYRQILGDVRDRARDAGRQDLASALDAAIERSTRRDPWLTLSHRMRTTTGLWRVARWWQRTLLRDFVH
jgi:hypothetical protein